MMMFYKKNTLTEVYRTVELDYQNPNVKLYIFDQENNRILVPNVDNVTLDAFYMQHKSCFVPIYPMPARVVYKMYYDDCTNHTDASNPL